MLSMLFSLEFAFATQAQSEPAAESMVSDTRHDERKQSGLPISEAERIMNLESTLQSDQEKLAKLKKETGERQQNSQNLRKNLEKLEQRLSQKRRALEALSNKGESASAGELKVAVEKLQQEHSLLDKQSELLIDSEKTTREQVHALEEKIARQQQLLNDLKGIEKTTSPTHPQALTPARSTKADQGETVTPSPMQRLVPGAVIQATEGFDVRKDKVLQLSETEEQLEARKEAEKKVEEATKAAQVVVDYVGLKEDLREQITLEERQLRTTVQSRTNYEHILHALEKELQESISAGANKSELQKIKGNIARSRKEIAGADKQIEQQKENLSQLRERRKEIQEERLTVVEEAQEKREEAEKATKKSIWLQSPLHPDNLLEWIYTRAPRVVMVVAGMLLLLLIIRISVSRLMKVMVRTSTRVDEFSQDRAETLALSFRGVAKAFILFGGVLLILQEAGLDITTVLGGAAILGVAVAFGAQGLMRDYLTGFMILVEDQYKLNDVVTIGDVTGKVEKVSMRTTVLRDQEGHVHFIPNGEIKGVTNNTYEWAHAVFEIGIAQKENVDRTMEVLVELASEFCKDPVFGDYITGKPDMLGVDRFSESGIVIKFRLKTKPDKMWPVKREMLRRIKNRFDELGIEIPMPLQDIFKQKNSS